MRITFLGGADEVGASAVLVEAGGRRVLVDAGIRMSGLAGDKLPDLSAIDRAGGLDACLVTHAHTDHTGALALVVERHPDCPVYATAPTAALTRVLQHDAQRIMKDRLDREDELPLFDLVAVEKLLAAFRPVPARERVPLAPGLVVTFYPAGHIAGAAMVALETDEGSVLVSGDIAISPQRTVTGAKPPPLRPDALVLESTYGGRLHANRAAEEARLVETISEVVAAGGKVLVPAFALGRAQEVVLVLNAFRARGLLPEVPVWIDGMVRAVCGVYRAFPDDLSPALREAIEAAADPFLVGPTRAVEHAGQREALLWEPGPAVIVSSSGMLAGGPSPQYARALAGDARNAILLTGYQDEEAPGRQLQQIAARGEGSLKLGEQRVKVRCRLGTYSLSAHADEGQLISLAEVLDPAEVFLVHGDEGARASLAARLAERGRPVQLPRIGQSFERRYRQRAVAPPVAGLGVGRDLDVRRLWAALVRAGGGCYTVDELARAWWGGAERAAEVAAALAADDLYFVDAGHGAALWRVRGEAQVAASEDRRARLAAHRDLAGQVVVVRPIEGTARPGVCVAVGRESLTVRFDPGGDAEDVPAEGLVEAFGAAADGLDADAVALARALLGPGTIASLLAGDAPRALASLAAEPAAAAAMAAAGSPGAAGVALCLALLDAGARRTDAGYRLPGGAAVGGPMEPNTALAAARDAFPPDARLRRVGYRLADGVLVLTFDFPDAARTRHVETIAALAARTGWQVELTPEANQGALVSALREVLPDDWEVAKAPSFFREERRLAVTCHGAGAERAGVAERFKTLTGFDLHITLVDRPPAAAAATAGERLPAGGDNPGEPWEINAAYAAARECLAGTSLYRTSLKGGTIVLSFISREVGERHAGAIAALADRIGWPLAINPTPNQQAILAAVESRLAGAGWRTTRQVGLHADRAEVTVTVAGPLDETDRAAVAEDVLAETGYRLVVAEAAGGTAAASGAGPGGADPSAAVSSGPAALGRVVQVPLSRLRLSAAQASLQLDPDKTRRAIERVRRAGGVMEPVVVRRAGDAYRLVDGVRRVRVAEELGWSTVPAIVEE